MTSATRLCCSTKKDHENNVGGIKDLECCQLNSLNITICFVIRFVMRLIFRLVLASRKGIDDVSIVTVTADLGSASGSKRPSRAADTSVRCSLHYAHVNVTTEDADASSTRDVDHGRPLETNWEQLKESPTTRRRGKQVVTGTRTGSIY